MKTMRWLVILLLLAAVAAAVIGWQKVAELRTELAALRAENQALKSPIVETAEANPTASGAELRKLRADALDALRLRNEVTQLRSGTKELEKARAENQQLRAENQQLRAGNTATTPPATAPPPEAKDHFPRDSWAFAGYSTPESALVSAIWAMREGNPKAYFDSLSTEEQTRMGKAWETKTETEIIAKHQADVSKISGVRVLERETTSPDRMMMSVYIEGVGRMEKVSMQRVGEEWRFGGFIRNPPR